ncbi:hypothetical protein T440DRAFT_56978 [Plenodomus tracheiphilus IPT5]|uniref:Pheromone alpha factor receptor n=1 Tax=Plenodomus tracheiphilus IPT5 TaxID=1408161 RepID=A0A6A7BBD6_9PLEO|nr:hypothetical protein T440DRAFT_56978 [Plenodomus tracheiphilus IPT5]
MSPTTDPWNQTFTIIDADGNSQEVHMAQLTQLQIYITQSAINYGAQFGASILLLLVLLLLTKASKRRSYIFLINGFCLLVNAIRCVLLACLLTGNWYNPYTQIMGDYSRVTNSDNATSIASVLLTLLIAFLVFMSLGLQVWVVCVTTQPIQRGIVMALTTLVGVIAVGYRFALAIYNIKALLTQTGIGSNARLVSDCYIVQAVAIWVYSCVFTYKLGYAILQRRRLNMPQFGPMQVVFIMGCQTMVIPAIMTSLQFVPNLPELGNAVLTIVCIFLPLSAIWAGVEHDSGIASSGPDSHHRLFGSEFYNSTAHSVGTSSSTAYDKSRQVSIYTIPKSKDRDIESMNMTPKSYKRSHIDQGSVQADPEYGPSGENAANCH